MNADLRYTGGQAQRKEHPMDTFENYRSLLFGIAYRMLGSVMEAEDMVQEAYLRYQATPPESIRAPKAFLATVVTRLCLDHLKSAQEKRTQYFGPWLPEPLLTDDGAPQQRTIERESLSMAFLVLLESLSPAERAVFLLHEVFDYDYDEIAPIVGKEEAACRQLLHRAKQHINEHRPRFQPTAEEHREILGKFMMAVGSGDVQSLTSLLAEDVVSWGDGGGKAHAGPRPMVGRDVVAKLLIGLGKRIANEGYTFLIEQINGQPALVYKRDGQAFGVVLLDIGDGKIHGIRSVINPDKLRHL
ncbi:MAG: RNA polymerase sigma-70 factor [Anaerolineae bacterium]